MPETSTDIRYPERYVQSTLFGLDEASEAGPHGRGAQFKGKSVFSDPAFAQNKTLPIHRWVPWIAGFSQDFVRDALKRHLKDRGTVLDPFCGVGTTLVESVLAGHDAVGFEINPYAALACEVKLRCYGSDLEAIRRQVRAFRFFFDSAVGSGLEPRSRTPEGFKTRGDFYSPKVLRQVLLLQDFIETIEDREIRNLFRLAFASTMVNYSNYSYEPSLGQRKSAGREGVEDFPVGRAIEAKLSDMVQDIAWMRERLGGRKPESKVINRSFFECPEHLKPESVHLLITSPPYLNNYHYNRNTRPHLYWLGFVKKPKDLEPLERDNFGKYWQTVREEKCVELFPGIADPEIIETVGLLRNKTPEKGIYGGNGWANYAASYFNDCYRFSQCAKYVLRRGGTALVVIGNSILQGVLMPTDRFLVKIAESVGLEAVEIHVPRASRVGNSIIQSAVRVEKAQDSDSLYEAVVELRKR
jgi:hypothetical protein